MSWLFIIGHFWLLFDQSIEVAGTKPRRAYPVAHAGWCEDKRNVPVSKKCDNGAAVSTMGVGVSQDIAVELLAV